MLYCIGDSHVTIFCNQDISVKSFVLQKWYQNPDRKLSFLKAGPWLAYNLPERVDSIRGFLTHTTSEDSLLFYFGEIDCRVHVLKQSRLQKMPSRQIIEQCVDRYLSTVQLFIESYHTIRVMAVPPPPASDIIPNSKFPSCGTAIERREVARQFNLIMKEKIASSPRIKFVAPNYEPLLLKQGQRVFIDKIHLRPSLCLPCIYQALDKEENNEKNL